MAFFARRGILPREGGLDRQRHRDIAIIERVWGAMPTFELE
jgi:hypothetical protein